MIIDDKYIINYFYSKNGNGRYCPKRLNDINDEIKEYLINRFNDSSSLIETIYRIHDNLEIRPHCKICGGYVKFNELHNKFDNTCSINCGNKFRHLNKQKSIKKIYGVDNIFQNENIKQKIKQIKLDKYGDENYNNNEKTVKTCLKKYGVRNGGGSPEVIEKNKKYFLEKYGETSPAKVEQFKEKSKKTCLEKYGYEYSHQNPIVREKTSKTIQARSIEEWNKIWNKNLETQHKNGTLTTSKPEEESYILIKSKFNDVIRQYKELRYPFFCDFYIPSLDLFIECQYSFFHNGRPYIGNENDLKEIEIIKEKSLNRKQITNKKTTRYDTLINTWTIRDVNKRNIAKQNNLNYLEFFTILDLKNWLNKYETK